MAQEQEAGRSTARAASWRNLRSAGRGGVSVGDWFSGGILDFASSHVQCGTRSCELLRPLVIADESVVANLHETRREDVQAEPPQELDRAQGCPEKKPLRVSFRATFLSTYPASCQNHGI